MAITTSLALPLQEKFPSSNAALKRASDVFILFLLLSLLAYRLSHIRSHGTTWVLAFLCEACFTFVWLLTTNTKWNHVTYKTYPERLLDRFSELPPVDMFVTTADSTLEPPIITVDTVLSLLAVDYPVDKLACYVSDDGASAVTFYSLVEASKFAKLWVPFCKKYKVKVRAPSFYFSSTTGARVPAGSSSDFAQEWRSMKEEYQELSRRIEEAVESKAVHVSKDLADFWKIERGNHPSIVKVIVENKDNYPDGLPQLVYVAREKRPKCPHNFKAGAMNVLTRVSAVMTNAPFMLNVDCDMFANNPQIILHAMCLLLGSKTERDSGFVQYPQHFHGLIKDDPFGNAFIVLQAYLGRGLAGLQGPMYGGTGCFHRRKVIYGQHPLDHQDIKEAALNLARGESSWEILRKKLGPSPELLNSAAKTLWGRSKNTAPKQDISGSVRAAMEVADCHYEKFNGTSWGQEVGWVYGSATEDVLTGLKIHCMGWKSAYCTPDPPGFLGCVPTGGPSCLTQMKRWATGLAEILFSRHSPLLATMTKKLQFRQCLGYGLICIWGLRSIPELCYSLLPAYCLISNHSFLPKLVEPAVVVPAVLFVFYHLYTLQEFIACGQTVKAWWNNMRMGRIMSTTAWLFGIVSVAMKLLGLSETMFEITRKDQNASGSEQSEDPGRFTFDMSPIFVPGVAFVFVHFAALVSASLKILAGIGGSPRFGLGEIVCSVWLLSAFLPFIKGLFRRGCYGIPWPIIIRAVVLAFLFFIFSART